MMIQKRLSNAKSHNALESDLTPSRSNEVIKLDDNQASLYGQLHENIKARIREAVSASTVTSDIGSEPDNITAAIEDIHKNYGHAFKQYAQRGDKILLSRYVAALDKTNESRTYDSIYIHYMALVESYHSKPSQAKREATKYLASAVATNQTFTEIENSLRNEYIKDFKEKNSIPDSRALTQDETVQLHEYVDEKLETHPETRYRFFAAYKSIIDTFGHAPFLLRTGKKGSQTYSHYASAIVQKDRKTNKYNIRFENPSSSRNYTYQIKDGKLDDVLWALHKVYMNGSPLNNLGNSDISAAIIGKENVEREIESETREAQTGMQCGIHSSRRIIPASIYAQAGLKDCDILGMCEL